MITGIGLDLVELARIEKAFRKFDSHFLRKILTPLEISLLPASPIPWIAGRFAAKEACAKAFGTGFSNGLTFMNIEALNNSAGKPELQLKGQAAVFAQSLKINKIFLSITHERSVAAAIVILETS